MKTIRVLIALALALPLTTGCAGPLAFAAIQTAYTAAYAGVAYGTIKVLDGDVDFTVDEVDLVETEDPGSGTVVVRGTIKYSPKRGGSQFYSIAGGIFQMSLLDAEGRQLTVVGLPIEAYDESGKRITALPADKEVSFNVSATQVPWNIWEATSGAEIKDIQIL